MLRSNATSGRARPPVEPPSPDPRPDQLWLIRNRRTGKFIKSHQESCMMHREILLTCASAEAVDAALKFLKMYASVDPEPVQVL